MPLILIIDDEMYQRTLIRETLANDESLTFAEAENGRRALEIAPQLRPDVIILDVMMPVVNGFQVCKVLKNDPTLRAVPVILVTALGSVEDKVAGLDSGADDFVNKPFEETELQARVRSALRIKLLHDQLQQTLQMHENLVRMMMHDMGNLVAVVRSGLGLYLREPDATPESLKYVKSAYDDNILLGNMLNDALDVGSMENRKLHVELEETDLVDLLQNIVASFEAAALDGEVHLNMEVEPNLDPAASVDRMLIRRIVGNLLTNALKYAPEKTTITVCVESGANSNWLALSVNDQGSGISPDELATIFNKYEQAQRYVDHRGRSGRGLGLAFSKMAVEAHNGKISVHSTLGEGTAFKVEIPRR